jgi:polygalacturonase
MLVASVLMHTVFVSSSNVKVHNVTIETSLDAPRTDGIVPGMTSPPPSPEC